MSRRASGSAPGATPAGSGTASGPTRDIFGEGEDQAEGSATRASAQDELSLEQRDPGLEEDEEEEEEGEEEAGGDRITADTQLQDEEGQEQMEGDLYGTESPSDSGTDSLTWISWFCSLPGHEYFAEVGEDFIEDDFNLTGLNALVPFYKEALEMILDVEPQEDSLKIPDVSIVESSAELLYGLIHQRYILTRQGLQQMVEKYERGHFGFCPRVFCHSHPVLPCGRSDLPGLDTVKLFCANCIDNYSPPSSRFHGVDGAFFGTTFPHLLFQTYRELAPAPIAAPGTNFASLNTQTQPQGSSSRTNGVPSNGKEGSVAPSDTTMEGTSGDHTPQRGTASVATTTPTLQQDLLGRRAPQGRLYTPRIYGFRVSEQAKSGPRMRWMRMRPESFEELDQGIVRSEAGPGQSNKAGALDDASEMGSVSRDDEGQGAEQQQAANAAAATMSPEARRNAAGVTASGRSVATGRPIAGRSSLSATKQEA